MPLEGPNKLPVIVTVEIGQLILFLAAKYMQKCFGYNFKCSNTNVYSVCSVMMPCCLIRGHSIA